MNEYIFAEEVAALRKCSIATLYAHVRAKLFPGATHRIGNRVAWERDAVMTAIADRVAKPVPLHAEDRVQPLCGESR